MLSEFYSVEHQVILYEAATLSIQKPKIRFVKLKELSTVELDMKTTLVIPPSTKLERNASIISRLEELTLAGE